MAVPLCIGRVRKPGRRQFLLSLSGGSCAAALATLVSATGCTPPKVKDNRLIHQMGERVTVGSLTFNVLESQWMGHIGEMPHQRMPKHQFLALRLSVTNGGGKDAGFPLLNLINETDERFPEVDDAKQLADWMGLIRSAGPAETALGYILFDVPQAPYKLELTDGKIENEQTSLVEIPLRLQ